MFKPKIKNPVLKTWIGLNDVLRTAPEEYCKKLLREELRGRRRLRFLLRIHSRLNSVRAKTERRNLMRQAVRARR